MKITKTSFALFLAILFHVSGLAGILFTPYKGWFIGNTPLNLVLMFLLLVFVQEKKSINFFMFFLIAFATGMVTEIIGVNTGKLFGNYAYGSVLGLKVKNVPLLIGLNWFVTVYCSGVIMEQVYSWSQKKYKEAGLALSSRFSRVAIILDGALIATFFDWLMEPAAIKLGFWKWEDDVIPYYNYLCWYLISVVLLIIFRLLKFNKHNHLAVHLFIIQVLFFLVLRTFL